MNDKFKIDFIKHIIHEVFRVLILLFIVSTIVFFIFSILPSDPIRSIVGINASEEAVAALRNELGYDHTITSRYFHFITSFLRFDFEKSLVTRRSIGPDISHAYLLTLCYVSIALALSITLSLCLVFWGILGPPVFKKILLNLSTFMTSFPSLVVATSIGILLVRSGFLWGINLIHGRGLIFAVIALSVYPIFSLTEIALRESDNAASSQAAMSLRSLGFTNLQIFWYYMLRPTLSPWISHLSNTAASLVAGSVIIESVFSLPGLGRLLIQSVLRGDFPMIQGLLITSVSAFVLIDWSTRFASDRIVGRIKR